MPPNTNDTPDQTQPTNPIAPETDAAPTMPDAANISSVNDTMAPSSSAPLQDAADATLPPAESATPAESTSSDTNTNLASPPPVNEADIPANNRPTLDTINNTPQEAPTSDSLESEINGLPETAPIDNPIPIDAAPPAPSEEAPNSISSQAAEATPAPTPPAFPENSSAKPEKKGFFSKFFKHK